VTFECPACGYTGLREAPWDDKNGGSQEICTSCGIQFGYDDAAGGDTSKRKTIYRHWNETRASGRDPREIVLRQKP
jgi:transcription elongation factor Elf1